MAFSDNQIEVHTVTVCVVVEIFTWDEDSGGSPVNASSIRAMEAMIDFRRISYLLYLDCKTKFYGYRY